MTEGQCEKHNWYVEKNAVCPVCEGIELERSRILSTLEASYTGEDDDWAIDWAIEIVKGVKEGYM